MPKHARGGGGGAARIRLVILEAEAPDGDLSEVTQAVQNALRPTNGMAPVRRSLAGPAKVQPADNDPVELEAEDANEAEHEEEAESPSSNRSRASTSKPRSPRVVDVDLKSGKMPFEQFAKEKNPQNHAKRNLVVAAWFKLHRGVDTVSMDDVYTCYREVNWPTGMADFGITLRQLKTRKFMDSGKEKGTYAINHIGINEVSKMGAGRAA